MNKIEKQCKDNRASIPLLTPYVGKIKDSNSFNNHLLQVPDRDMASRSFNTSKVSLIVQDKLGSLDNSLLLIKSKMQKMKSMSRKIRKNESFLLLKCKNIKESLNKFKGRYSILSREKKTLLVKAKPDIQQDFLDLLNKENEDFFNLEKNTQR